MRTPNNDRVSADIAALPGPCETMVSGEGKPLSRKVEPERRCILTGTHGARGALVRLAISPEGQVLPDVHAKAPGRGAWLGVDRTALEIAMAKGRLKAALARAFKTGALDIAADLPDRIEAALQRALTDRLGLEMRSGTLVIGTQRIAETARAGGIALLLHARDASEDGRRKLDQAWRVGREREGSGERGVILPLDRAALSVALGRENVVHLALADDRAAERIMHPLQRLVDFRGLESGRTDTDHGAETGPPDTEYGGQRAAPRPDDAI